MSRTAVSPVEVSATSGEPTATPQRRPGWRVLGQALALWWAATVLGSVASATPLLPWFDVLRDTPFASVKDDLALLHERLFSAATTAHLLPAGALFQATLQQLLLWRVVLLMPSAMVMCASVSPQRSLAGAATKTVLLLPRFFLLTLTLQSLAVVVTGLGLSYAWGWLARPEVGAFELGVGLVVGATSLALGVYCLTLLELSRVALFERPSTLTPTRTSTRTAWSSLLDGLDELRRQPFALASVLGGYFALGLAASFTLSAAATAWAARAPEGLGQGLSWLLVQVGVAVALCCRALGWREVHRRAHASRRETAA